MLAIRVTKGTGLMKARKTYEKPKLGKVKVRTEDSVLSYCRETGAPGDNTEEVCGGPTVNFPS